MKTTFSTSLLDGIAIVINFLIDGVVSKTATFKADLSVLFDSIMKDDTFTEHERKFIVANVEYACRVQLQRATAGAKPEDFDKVSNRLKEMVAKMESSDLTPLTRQANNGQVKALSEQNASLINTQVAVFMKMSEQGMVYDQNQLENDWGLKGAILEAVCKQLHDKGYFDVFNEESAVSV